MSAIAIPCVIGFFVMGHNLYKDHVDYLETRYTSNVRVLSITNKTLTIAVPQYEPRGLQEFTVELTETKGKRIPQPGNDFSIFLNPASSVELCGAGPSGECYGVDMHGQNALLAVLVKGRLIRDIESSKKESLERSTYQN